MPGSETTATKRGGLLSLLFWAGVALAPLAAVVLLLSQGETMLRAAVVVAVLAVVLIGLSIALRPGPENVRAELEDTVFDEVDALREDIRRDITTAAKATHKAFGERVQALQETVDGLRAQLDGRGPFERPDVKAPPVARAASGHAPVGGVVRHTETVQVTTRRTIVDADEGRGRVYGGSVYGTAAAEPAPRPRGRADEWTPPPSCESREPREPRESREQREESWTEKRLRERLADRAADRDSDSERPGRRWARTQDPEVDRGRGFGDDPGTDEGFANFRAGDRWASVRSDDRGRELRMGERRAAVRADEHGTELRIEDRWAAVRREESSRPHQREARWTDDSGGWSSHRDDSRDWSRADDSGDWSPRRSARAALPAASAEPPASAWTGGEPESGGWRSRQRDDDGRWGDDRWERERDEPARVPRQRRVVDFETSEDRWR